MTQSLHTAATQTKHRCFIINIPTAPHYDQTLSRYCLCTLKNIDFHSQLQKFCLQLIFFIWSARHAISALTALEVFPNLLDKRSDKVYQAGAAATKGEDVILLLLLAVRNREFGHLVQHGGEGHAQR